jgi:hypothetical protein
VGSGTRPVQTQLIKKPAAPPTDAYRTVNFGGLECAGHSFLYVAHLVFLEDVCKILLDFLKSIS